MLANILFPGDLQKFLAPTGCIYGQHADNKLVRFAFTKVPDSAFQEKGWKLIISKAFLLYLENCPITLDSKLRRAHREIIRIIFTDYFKWLTDWSGNKTNIKRSSIPHIDEQAYGDMSHNPSLHLMLDSANSIGRMVWKNSDGSITIKNGNLFLQKINQFISDAPYYKDLIGALNNLNYQGNDKDATVPLTKKQLADAIGIDPTALSHDSKLKTLFESYQNEFNYASIPFHLLWPFVRDTWNRRKEINNRKVFGFIKTIDDVRRLFGLGFEKFYSTKIEEKQNSFIQNHRS
jgi:hypothetical protein